MKSTTNGGFQDLRTTRDRVKTGEIPKWLIDRWVEGGHVDPRKEYRIMTLVNITCLLWIAFIVVFVGLALRAAIYSNPNMGIGGIIATAVCVGVVVAGTALTMWIRGMFQDRMEKLTQPFETMLGHLIRSPRPQFVSSDLASETGLLRSIEWALTDLAARKIVFLEYEQTTFVGIRKLSDFAHGDIGNLFDVAKELKLIGEKETYTRFFQRAEVGRVSYFRREFAEMLKGLPKGELPPLFW